MVTLCINQINDCPVANDDSFIINEGFVLDSTVAANDTDGDINTDDNNYVLLTFPAVGQIEMRSDGSFIYTSPTQISAPGPEIDFLLPSAFIFTLRKLPLIFAPVSIASLSLIKIAKPDDSPHTIPILSPKGLQ